MRALFFSSIVQGFWHPKFTHCKPNPKHLILARFQPVLLDVCEIRNPKTIDVLQPKAVRTQLTWWFYSRSNMRKSRNKKKTSALQSCNLNGCSNFQANNLLPLKCNFPKEWKSPTPIPSSSSHTQPSPSPKPVHRSTLGVAIHQPSAKPCDSSLPLPENCHPSGPPSHPEAIYEPSPWPPRGHPTWPYLY